MTSRVPLTMAACAIGSAVAFAQSLPPRVPATPYTAKSVQAPIDPGYAELIKTCKTPPPARGGGPGRGGPGGPGRAGGPPAPAAGVREYKVTEIPGVIAAGQQWKFLWQEVGNNGDGILSTNDGLLLAQNDNSQVLKLNDKGQASVAYSRHPHRRRVVDEPEGRAVHGAARAAGRTSRSSSRSARCSPTRTTATRSTASAASSTT